MTVQVAGVDDDTEPVLDDDIDTDGVNDPGDIAELGRFEIDGGIHCAVKVTFDVPTV